MIDKLRLYVEDIFTDVPKTRKNWELKEELIGNLQERFRDLTEEGMPEKEAYHSAMESLGNVNELLESLKDEGENKSINLVENNKKRAMLYAISAALYVLGAAVFMGIGIMGRGEIGLLLLLLIYTIPIGLNVYTAYAFPKYIKSEETVVEEFKEWQSNKGRDKYILKSIKSIMWMLTVILYFLISFSTGAWYITWIIYLVAVCVDQIINLLFSFRK